MYIKEYYFKILMADVQMFVTGKPNWGGAKPENRRSHWRYNEETSIYNNKPIDKDYFRKYMAQRVVSSVAKWFYMATYQNIKRGPFVLIIVK